MNNAYDAALLQGLHDAMDALGSGVRVVLLQGAGRHFQAGVDLKWIRAVAAESGEENERASRATALAVHRLNTLPVPTVALGGDHPAAARRRHRRAPGTALCAHRRASRSSSGRSGT